jgi:tight adherence protein C
VDEEDHMLVRLIERLPMPSLRRRPDMSASLVEFVDLLVVLLKSGRTTHQALDCITRWGEHDVRRVAERVLLRCEAGERLADATGELITVFGSAAVGIANTLAAAERDGLPVAPVLDRLVGESHAERRRLAQIDAAKLPIKLAFPLVTCVLPSFVALTVVPILIGALSSLTIGPLPG